MRQLHIFDRLVGDGTHSLDHLVGHRRRRLRVEHDAAVVADDHGRIGIALGGEGVEIGADLGEGDLLLRHVGRRRETLGHQFNPFALALSPSLRGAKQRSNPYLICSAMDCFASLAMTTCSYSSSYYCCCCCCWLASSI